MAGEREDPYNLGCIYAMAGEREEALPVCVPQVGSLRRIGAW